MSKYDQISKLNAELKKYQDWINPDKVDGIFNACLIATQNYEKEKQIKAELDKLISKKIPRKFYHP